MNIGELFVSLGVKGSEKSLHSIGQVRGALKSTASMGLETKAAIIGAVYALERMFSKSSQAGTDLTNFNATLGVSAKTLQQYQYAARQVGVSNEAVEQSFRGLQSTITKTLMGEQAPKGLARLAQITGDLDPSDLEKFSRNPELLMQKLQDYAQKETHAGLRNETLKSFGLGDDMIAAMTRNAFRPDVMAKAPTYSDSEIRNLDKANAAWKNLGNTVEMAFGRFNAQHGGKLVTDLNNMIGPVVKMTEAFVKLADKMKLFETLGEMFKGWAFIFEGITKAIDFMTNADVEREDIEKKTGFKSLADAKADAMKRGISPAQAEADYWAALSKNSGPSFLSDIGQFGKMLFREATEDPAPAASPSKTGVPKAPTNVQTQNNTTTINQNLNFQHDGKDAKATGDSTRQAVQKAFRQMPGLTQGS